MASEDAPVDTTEKRTGGRRKNPGGNGDDSLSAQLKNTKAQVSGTFQKLSTSFQQAGTKFTNAFSGLKNKVSSKK